MLAAEDIQLKRIKSHLTALQPRDLRDAPRPAIKSCQPNPRDSFVIGRQRRNVGDFGAPGGRSRQWETGTSGETGTKELEREKGRECGEKKRIDSLFLSLSLNLCLSLFIAPRSLRLICVKSHRNSSTGFSRGSKSRQGRRHWRVAPDTCVSHPVHSLHTTWPEQIVPISVARARSAFHAVDARVSAPRARFLSIHRPKKKVQWVGRNRNRMGRKKVR